jgi:Ca2+-binding RTX toxin-like protein
VATIVGTKRRDTIHGTRHADVIVGLGGGDTIFGGKGRDLICGDGGGDTLHGGPGNDRLYGGTDGGPCDGNVDCDAGIHGDILDGAGGADLLDGGYDHRAVAQAAADSGDRDPDVITYAGASRPIHADLAAGTVTGQGHDRLVLRGAWTELVGSPFDDTIVGSPGVDRVDPGKGDDTVRLGAGPDTVESQSNAPQHDTIDGGSGDDLLQLDGQHLTLDLAAGDGDDVVNVSDAQHVVVDAGPGEDSGEVAAPPGSRITGGDGYDRIALGLPASDDAASSFDAGTGTLTLLGGGVVTTSGLDDYIFDAQTGAKVADNVLTFTGTDGADQVWSKGYPLHAQMLGGDDEVIGSIGDDVVDGGAGTDYFSGVAGTDTCTNVETGPC